MFPRGGSGAGGPGASVLLLALCVGQAGVRWLLASLGARLRLVCPCLLSSPGAPTLLLCPSDEDQIWKGQQRSCPRALSPPSPAPPFR